MVLRPLAILLLLLSAVAAGASSGLLGTGDDAGPPLPPGASLAAPPVPIGWPDELTIYAAPAPAPLSWRSPASLVRSVLGARLATEPVDRKHGIGHMFVRLRTSDPPRDELVGMTTADPAEEETLLRRHGYALGIMAADMAGRFDDRESLEKEVAQRTRVGRLGILRVLLPRGTGTRLAGYLDGYRARGADRHYGNASRPRHAEGGGCAPFAVSFLDVAGLLEPEYAAAWKIDLALPRDLVGGPLTGQWISPWDVTNRESWARPGEPQLPAEIWDPSRVFAWILAQHDREVATPTGRWSPAVSGKCRGLVVDARARPTPTDPVFRADPPGTPHPFGRQPGLAALGAPLTPPAPSVRP